MAVKIKAEHVQAVSPLTYLEATVKQARKTAATKPLDTETINNLLSMSIDVVKSLGISYETLVEQAKTVYKA